MNDDLQDELERVVTLCQVATRLKVPVSLVRYAIDAGCPTRDGMLSPREFLDWFSINYNEVRRLAGLQLLPVKNGSEAEVAKAQFRDSMLTMVEFIESRSSNLETKEAATDVRDFLIKRSEPN